MSDNTSPLPAERVEALLYEHREDALTCYDHAPTPERPVWCCVCGEHELTTSWRAHVAQAFASHVAAWLAEVWDQGYATAKRNGEKPCRPGNPYRGDAA